MKPHNISIKKIILPFIASFLVLTANSQDTSLVKLNTFQPVVSAMVLQKDAIDVTMINTLSSFWLAYHKFDDSFTSSYIADRARYTTFEHLIRVSYGFDQEGRWDLGAEMRFSHVRLDNAASNSPFKALGNDNETGTSYHGLSYLGLRARWMPFEDLPGLTVQATTAFPIAKNADKRRNLNAQRVQTGIGVTLLESFTRRTKYFLQAEWRTLFSNDEVIRTVHVPALSGFLIFDIYDNKVFVFPGLSYSTGLNKNLNQLNSQLFGSLGIQFQPEYTFAIFLNAQTPFIFESGSEITEWVRQSYTGINLGFRLFL